MNITDILALTFFGNYAADAHTFQIIDDFVLRTDVSNADKCAALHHASAVGMGIPDPITEADLIAYLRDQ